MNDQDQIQYGLYFVGKYMNTSGGEPMLIQKVQHDLTLETAELLTSEYNERAGHKVDDVAIHMDNPMAAYFMYDEEDK